MEKPTAQGYDGIDGLIANLSPGHSSYMYSNRGAIRHTQVIFLSMHTRHHSSLKLSKLHGIVYLGFLTLSKE